MSLNQDRLDELRLFLTLDHSCNYLPGRRARNLVADLQAIDNLTYSQLAQLGFRRSGAHVYRPHCTDCQACLSLRIPVSAFRTNRSQQRIWRKNQDLRVSALKSQFKTEHYLLFKRYLKTRHQAGGMDDTDPQNYLGFITSNWSDTLLYEFRLNHHLLAVAVVDHLNDGLSAVYTFFEPDASARGLGNYAILWQISEAKRLGLSWVYLGYWIEECKKMAYKANFYPHEVFWAGHWQPVASAQR